MLMEEGVCEEVMELYLNWNDGATLWTAHMSHMNEENEWDQIVDADNVEGPIERVIRVSV